jgi:hypothetical protein
MKLDPPGWSALHQEALELLLRRGLLEKRFRGGDATGRGVFVVLSGPVSDEMMAETFSTNSIAPDKPQVNEVRLSAEGQKARSMLNGDEAVGDAGEVVAFIFWDKLYGKVESVVQVEPLSEVIQPQWSDSFSHPKWLELHESAGCGIEKRTFERRIAVKDKSKIKYTVKEPRENNRVIIDINTLPPPMQPKEFWDSQ